ncbi:MAG: UvrD-helicase domain-containing protein [Candidatus Methanomethylophilaceae archaeon]
MSELNPSQKAIAEGTDGFYVVDAGPGTGKTHTVVSRFVNILKKPDVDTKDILLLTFTKNAASEMEERIRAKLSEIETEKPVKLIQAGTFDSFCYSVVKESPETVSSFLGIKERLTRSASLVENETLNKEYFFDFFDRFNDENGAEYGDTAVCASTHPEDIYRLITRLMSKGIVPVRGGWFGGSDGKDLLGDTASVLEDLRRMNADKSERKKLSDKISKKISDGKPISQGYSVFEEEFPDEILISAAEDDRTELLNYIHDVYYSYIRRSVSDDRLTFGLNAVFAFIILYSDRAARNRLSCRYLMIDEFQDTNENQMMIALMLLKEPNLCVVGDWKQGIYGFRFVSIDNIVDFEKRAEKMRRILNEDGEERVPYRIPKINRLSLDINYRSSQKVIDTSFACLKLKGSKDDNVRLDESTITLLKAHNGDFDGNTHVRYVKTEKENEAEEAVSRIIDYVTGNYLIKKGGEFVRPSYRDIAVLCKTGAMCRAVDEAAKKRGVSAYLQGDVEIMATREGKLALAWLRYVNNDRDAWGITGILSDMDYPYRDIKRIIDSDSSRHPEFLVSVRKELMGKKRRITDLLSSIFAVYGLNNDKTQAIISTLSSAHRSSLLTVSDLIRIMETDIKEKNTYRLDVDLDSDAVVIQTMHKSKGLEYPIVIIPGVDSRIIPSTRSDYAPFYFNERDGIRASEVLVRSEDGFTRSGYSWKTDLVKNSAARDYSEDRRTLFVAVSRAKQYVTMICGDQPSQFMKDLSGEKYSEPLGYLTVPPSENKKTKISKPVPEEYPPKRINMGVHDIMEFKGNAPEEGADELSGKGMEYGTKIHSIAEAMAIGIEPKEDLPEIPVIREILESVKDADLVLSEVQCILPLDGINVTLRGIIDLLALYPDRAVVRDYKTDVSEDNLDAYKLQLSVYAHAVSGFYSRPVTCTIDYVSLGKTVEFEPLTLNEIEEAVVKVL